MQAGGPYIEVLTGRRDSVSASKQRADKQLPASDISIDQFIQIFSQNSITLEEGVALIGMYIYLCKCLNLQNYQPRINIFQYIK